jgi:hypothetical protein
MARSWNSCQPAHGPAGAACSMCAGAVRMRGAHMRGRACMRARGAGGGANGGRTGRCPESKSRQSGGGEAGDLC